jgi:hypothetical protein
MVLIVLKGRRAITLHANDLHAASWCHPLESSFEPLMVTELIHQLFWCYRSPQSVICLIVRDGLYSHSLEGRFVSISTSLVFESPRAMRYRTCGLWYGCK